MTDNKLSVIDLHKRYGEHEVLKGVSLKAKAGDVISIIGSSGSGKVPSCAASTFWRSQAKERLSSMGRILAGAR